MSDTRIESGQSLRISVSLCRFEIRHGETHDLATRGLHLLSALRVRKSRVSVLVID
jgi:hypothetical protein